MAKEIPLTQGEDYERVAAYRWQADIRERTCYAQGFVDGRMTRLHRFILGAQKGQLVDHRNGNGLDNTRQNIRIASVANNRTNHILPSRNKWGCYGVNWHGGAKKWMATIVVAKKRLYLGLYMRPEDAGRAYDQAAKKHFGEFASLNFSA